MRLPADWYRLSDERLLDHRICDLPIRIEGSFLQAQIDQLYDELRGQGIRFRPHVWLSDEWFSPDGAPGIAIPFYLAHPRLMRLERNQMLEVEGGTATECMRILRHEAGHALDTAFRLHQRKRWRELFGSFTRLYPESYTPTPESRDYVLHLRAWYAQAHPAEDWAETFAVWLSPKSRWQRRYEGWTALDKLEFVDETMKQISRTAPRQRSRAMIDPLSSLRMSLRDHYIQKRKHYEFDWPDVYDRDLRRIFTDDPAHSRKPSAAKFLQGARRELRQTVADGTGIHQYTIDHVLANMVDRCKSLHLRVGTPLRDAHRRMLIVLTVQVMNVLHSGYHRIAV